MEDEAPLKQPASSPSPGAEMPVGAAQTPVQTTPSSTTNAGQPQRVMDVVAPPLQTPEEAAETAQNNQAEPSPSVAQEAQQMADAKSITKPKTKSGNDTTVAIVATMVIVIALALLATYAFLKQ